MTSVKEDSGANAYLCSWSACWSHPGNLKILRSGLHLRGAGLFDLRCTGYAGHRFFQRSPVVPLCTPDSPWGWISQVSFPTEQLLWVALPGL